VLRQRIVIPLDQLLASGNPQPLSAEELSQRARQSTRSQPLPPQPTAEVAPSSAASEDPFRDDASPTEAPEAAATTPPTVESTAEERPEAEEVTETGATSESGEEMPEAEATPEAEENPFDFE
jgi:hypothetical protein